MTHWLVKKAVTHRQVPSNILFLMFRRNCFEARIPAFIDSLNLRPTDRKEIQCKCRESEFLTKVQEALLNEENISNDYSIRIAWKPQSWDTQEKVEHLNLEICFLPLPQQTKEFWGEITATEKSRMYRMQSKQMAGNANMGLARPRNVGALRHVLLHLFVHLFVLLGISF